MTATLSNLDMSRAACAGTDPVIFDNLNNARAAKEICASCPILADCREATLQLEKAWGVTSRDGVYAGMKPAERFAADRRRWPDVPIRTRFDADLEKSSS
jgi:hypothetical protein